MNLKYLFIVIALVFIGCSKEKTADSVINNYIKNTSNKNAVTYDVSYKIKYFDAVNDTVKYNSNCRLIRHENDTIFGKTFWIKNDSIDRYYDLKLLYIINHKKKEITRFFPHEGQTFPITGNTINGVLDSYFIKSERLAESLKDSTNNIAYKDTLIKGSKFHKIEMNYPDDLPVKNQKKTFYFNNENELKDITFYAEFDNENQYNEWHFSNEKYDDITDETLAKEFHELLKNYTIKDYEKPKQEMVPLLKNGEKAPNFSGLNYQTRDSVQLNDFKNKIVLIDFWYKACYPCIESIPYFVELRKKYPEEKLAILGLNPLDYESEDRMLQFPDFVKANNINYPVIFIEKQVAIDYRLKTFPTLYIIDKNGKIVLSEEGYNENTKSIDSLLQKLIK